jgi:hypothetical protein
MKFIHFEGSEFLMGARDEDPGDVEDYEKPQHKALLDAFGIAATCVTRGKNSLENQIIPGASTLERHSVPRVWSTPRCLLAGSMPWLFVSGNQNCLEKPSGYQLKPNGNSFARGSRLRELRIKRRLGDGVNGSKI